MLLKPIKSRRRITKALLKEWGYRWLTEFGYNWVGWATAADEGFSSRWHLTAQDSLIEVMVRHKLLEENQNRNTKQIINMEYKLNATKLNELLLNNESGTPDMKH